MKTLESRNEAWAANLCPHPDALARSVVELVREWQACCDRVLSLDGSSSP
jgi:hypothetical protein